MAADPKVECASGLKCGFYMDGEVVKNKCMTEATCEIDPNYCGAAKLGASVVAAIAIAFAM